MKSEKIEHLSLLQWFKKVEVTQINADEEELLSIELKDNENACIVTDTWEDLKKRQ